MVNAKLIRWCETEVFCPETGVKHYEIELKSLSISNRENDVGNVKISLMEMKSFVLPAKKGIERLVGEKKGQRRGYGNRSIPQSAHQVQNERERLVILG